MLIPLKSDLELQLVINADSPPRRGSFEVSVANAPSSDVKERTLIWTGLKNTPRAAKFPIPENIAKDLKLHLKLVDADQLKDDVNVDKSTISLGGKDVNEAEDTKVEASSSKKTKRGRTKK